MTDKFVLIRCEWGTADLWCEEDGRVIRGELCDRRAAYGLVDQFGKMKRLCREHARYLADLGLLDPRSGRPE